MSRQKDTDALLDRLRAPVWSKTLLLGEAADKIEALQAEVEELKVPGCSTLLADRTEELKVAVELTEFWIAEHHKTEASLSAALAIVEKARIMATYHRAIWRNSRTSFVAENVFLDALAALPPAQQPERDKEPDHED